MSAAIVDMSNQYAMFSDKPRGLSHGTRHIAGLHPFSCMQSMTEFVIGKFHNR